MTATVQPITRVVLTQRLDAGITGFERAYHWSPGCGPKLGEFWWACFEREWHWITFDAS